MYLNGKEQILEETITLEAFLLQHGYDLRTIAVERNNEIVPKATYANVILQDADRLEVVHFMGGGQDDVLMLGGHPFHSRFILGSGKFSLSLIQTVMKYGGSEIATIALRRANADSKENILDFLPKNITLLPNTSGARNAEEAIRIARLSRELGCGDFVKVEVIHDSKYLLPDNEETIKATAQLAKEGFIVLPYMYPDLIAARKLVDAGAAAIMPLGAPIGSNQGLRTKDFIRILIEEIPLPIIVDAGIGAPSQACEAMEMGAAAVMANTAVATAGDCAAMATAFRLAIEAGRLAYLSKLGRVLEHGAEASSPLTGFLQD
jgi:thiazole synthase